MLIFKQRDYIMKKIFQGLLLCAVIAIPSWFLGKQFAIIGGPVIAIVIGMSLNPVIKNYDIMQPGIKFTSKKILQYAVILLGFGLNLNVILKTGKQSLPIIVSTILTSLLLAYLFAKLFKIPTKISTLIGVGSSICGGSAIAATAPVIEANDDEVAQAISVIFFYNVLAAILFPLFGQLLGFSTVDGTAFGTFAGTAINDTSSVTAAASTWDTIFNLGTSTLDTAVTVKLTRTLAIIPITIVLGIYYAKKNSHDSNFSLKKVFPTFIIYFILASIITTITTSFGVSSSFFAPFKDLSKFFIIMAMAAIGLNTNVVKLIKSGIKPLALGFICWSGITSVSLAMQYFIGIW